jgi:hypothetical protein
MDVAKGTPAEAEASTCVSVLVLVSGIPVLLVIVYACIWPDAANRLLARGKEKLAQQLVEKMSEISDKTKLAAALGAGADDLWAKVEQELLTTSTIQVLITAISTGDYLASLLRASSQLLDSFELNEQARADIIIEVESNAEVHTHPEATDGGKSAVIKKHELAQVLQAEV